MSWKRHTTRCALSLLTVVLAFASCDRKAIYSHYEHTPLTGWERNDTLDYDIGPIAADGMVHEEVGLRINESYPFRGLCLIIEQTIYPAGLRRTDTLNCSLVSRDGNVKGQGISYYQYNFHLNDQRLQAGDSLHICVRHNMKREMLPGIADVGIMMSKASN